MWIWIGKNIMNVKFTIEYKGTNFCGWQIQKEQASIQGEITKAFKILFPSENINIVGSGRTDSGVHSKGQVASLKLPSSINLDDTFKSINGIISNDIFIKEYSQVDDDFNARFSATERTYKYYVINQFSPFFVNTHWHVRFNLDFNMLQKCAEALIGEKDFSGLSKNNPDIKNHICDIHKSFWEKSNNGLIYTIKANRFLHHMVRFIVGSSIQVASKKMEFEYFLKMIKNQSKISPFCAPSKGLFLHEVKYD